MQTRPGDQFMDSPPLNPLQLPPLCPARMQPVRCAELQIQLTEAVATLAGQKELVAKLEHDLSTIQALSAVHRPEAEVLETHNKQRLGFEVEQQLGQSLSLQRTCPAGMRLQLPGQQQDPGGVALPRHLWGAATPGLEKIPEPIKEATAQFYGERGARLGWDTPATGRVLKTQDKHYHSNSPTKLNNLQPPILLHE
ncbi:hypothetical protein DV515_00012765 [Chloebia gouldiae]|uniref:Uncharacterized protein n=1 Tax=Chloebia gouldiae TaxID=44316 RepID=A0A3L8S312_CHLGU|nr:hypothetical protein DV515_00012765 [Chloebia gouldiae]